MTTNARIGYGSFLQFLTSTGPDVWTTMGEQTNLTPPGLSADAVEATHNASPNARREFIAGLVDEGEASFDINLVPGGSTLADLRGYVRETVSARVIFPDSTLWTFDCLITGIEAEAPIDDKMSATITVKLTGESDIEAASAPTNSVLPAISGALTLGATLTAYEGVWQNGPTSYTYQWKNAGSNISGATNKTYNIQAGDSGDAITVAVTAINSAGNATATSAAVTAA